MPIIVATAGDTPNLTFKFTKANVPGALQTSPSGVNNAGAMVGYYRDKNNVFHGYILSGKKLTTLDDPNGTYTIVSNIQYNGTNVVGAYTNSSSHSVGFLYKNGKFTDITGPTGATGAFASAINDKGAIVGYHTYSTGRMKVFHGFLLKGTKYTTLDVPGAASTWATGINNHGNIVLYWDNGRGGVESSLYNGQQHKPQYTQC